LGDEQPLAANANSTVAIAAARQAAMCSAIACLIRALKSGSSIVRVFVMPTSSHDALGSSKTHLNGYDLALTSSCRRWA
jgi:hypothetical protein